MIHRESPRRMQDNASCAWSRQDGRRHRERNGGVLSHPAPNRRSRTHERTSAYRRAMRRSTHGAGGPIASMNDAGEALTMTPGHRSNDPCMLADVVAIPTGTDEICAITGARCRYRERDERDGRCGGCDSWSSWRVAAWVCAACAARRTMAVTDSRLSAANVNPLR